MRLNRFLAAAGLGSRRAVERLIEEGRVTVNGEPATLSRRVEPGDRVLLDGRELAREPLLHVLLRKPVGVVSTSRDPQGRPTVVDLVAAPVRLFAIGRLDADTSGVILLTNDGELAERLMHPRYGVEKTYLARVRGRPGPEALRQLSEGVELEDGPTQPARVRLREPDLVELTIHEGRNRQVRRMCAAVGHPVLELERTAFGGISAGDLEPGGWRPLRPKELERLRRGTGLAP